MLDYSPKPEHKFTFGLWTVGNIGRDLFGVPVRNTKTPAELVHSLGEVGYPCSRHFDAHAFRTDRIDVLRTQPFDRTAIATRGLKCERLDQLNIDLLLGVRA